MTVTDARRCSRPTATAASVELDHQIEWVNRGQELTHGASAMAILQLDFGR